MTRRTHTQLLLGEIMLFGLAMPHPRELMDPELQRIDELLDTWTGPMTYLVDTNVLVHVHVAPRANREMHPSERMDE